MGLLPPAKARNRSHWTDWLEMFALISEHGIARSTDLKKVLELQSDDDDHGVEIDPVTGEALEKEILEDKASELLEKVHEELVYRQKLCGEAYPFQIEYDEVATFGGGFKLKSRLGDVAVDNGYIFYVLALLETALRDQVITVADVNTSNHRLGLLFQTASCLAVGGYMNGPTIWFGFPRPDKTAFLPALKAAMERYGAHKVVSSIPPGFPAALKDGGIDIIAWLDFGDGRGARTVVFGQVASGYDWEGKTLLGFLPKFMNWFLPPQPAHVKPALLIPFPMHHQLEEDEQVAWEEQANGFLLYQSSDFGVIFDRFRVAKFAAKAIGMTTEQKSQIDGIDGLADVTDWLNALLSELKEKKAA